jgi:nitrite reductase (cytochrome c-552)
MDMATMNQEKETFLNTVVPQWLEKAKEREANYPVQIN